MGGGHRRGVSANGLADDAPRLEGTLHIHRFSRKSGVKGGAALTLSLAMANRYSRSFSPHETFQ
jgi:hypothetical protein